MRGQPERASSHSQREKNYKVQLENDIYLSRTSYHLLPAGKENITYDIKTTITDNSIGSIVDQPPQLLPLWVPHHTSYSCSQLLMKHRGSIEAGLFLQDLGFFQ